MDRSGLPWMLGVLPANETLYRENTGGKLSKWQLGILIGIPMAAAALVGLVMYYRRTWRRDELESAVPPHSVSPTPVSSPAAAVHAEHEADNKGKAQEMKQQGNNFYKQEKFEDAAKCYEEAIRLSVGEGEKDTVVATYYQNLAAVYGALVKQDTDPDLKANHCDMVIQNCDHAIALNPRYVKALLRRFKMHETLEHKEEAFLDVTRVLLLDESQAQGLSQSVTTLLKDISRANATQKFPELGPLAPTKHLVKTYIESFIWKDDLSEERLKYLWLNANLSDSNKVSLSVGLLVNGSAKKTQESASGDHRNENSKHGAACEIDKNQCVEGDLDKEEKVNKNGSKGSDLKGRGERNGLEEDVEFDQEPFVQAAAQFQRFELKDILELLSRALNKGNPVFKPHALLLRGGLFALWRMETQALKDLQELVNTPGLPKEMYANALIKKAGIYAGNLNLEKCKTCFDKVMAIAPDCTDLYVHKARVGLETEDVSNMVMVLEDLKKAASQAPNFPYVHYSLATTYHRMAGLQQSMQLMDTARNKFQDAVKHFPKFADGLILYALYLQDVGDFSAAEEILNKVIQLEPDNPLGHFSLGLLQLVVHSDLNKTMIFMQKAITVDSSCVQAYDTMASIEMQRGNTAQAVELYEKAVQFSRNQVEMSQAFMAQKIFTTQEQVCKEYGVPINVLSQTTQVP